MKEKGNHFFLKQEEIFKNIFFLGFRRKRRKEIFEKKRVFENYILLKSTFRDLFTQAIILWQQCI